MIFAENIFKLACFHFSSKERTSLYVFKKPASLILWNLYVLMGYIRKEQDISEYKLTYIFISPFFKHIFSIHFNANIRKPVGAT